MSERVDKVRIEVLVDGVLHTVEKQMKEWDIPTVLLNLAYFEMQRLLREVEGNPTLFHGRETGDHPFHPQCMCLKCGEEIAKARAAGY